MRIRITVLLIGVLLLTACSGSISTEATLPTPTSATTTAPVVAAIGTVVYEDGQPGRCKILEEKHCFSGEAVQWGSGMTFVGFSLPAETPLFAFGGGEAVEMFWSPDVTESGDAAESYPGVNIMFHEPDVGLVDATVLFMNRDGDPQLHLSTVDEGEWIGDLTSETLPVLPLGIQEGTYNLLVWLGDFDVASTAAYQEYFGLKVEP
jgi:hypothetical protein